MQSIQSYINESIEFENQCNEYLGSNFDNRIDEGIFDWLKKFMNKTTNFVKTWWEKGGKTVKASETEGTIQQNQKPITGDIDKLKKEFLQSDVWKKAFPDTTKYLSSNKHNNMRPEKIDKTKWNQISELFSVYTPKVHYNGENYPSSLCLYSPDIHLIDDYFHIHTFEVSSIIDGMSNKQLFETTVDQLFNNKKYTGITMNSDTQPKNLPYKSSSQWESTDVSDKIWKLAIR